MDHSTYVRDIATLRLSDAHGAGGEGANLGELAAPGLPVPPGFVLMRAISVNPAVSAAEHRLLLESVLRHPSSFSADPSAAATRKNSHG
jgi:hypothetical protein